MPVMAVPMWLAAAAPAVAQATAAPVNPAPPAGPVTQPAAPVVIGSPIVTSPSMLVWPFSGSEEVPSSAAYADNANLGATAAEDMVGYLTTLVSWQVVVYHPDDAYIKQVVAAVNAANAAAAAAAAAGATPTGAGTTPGGGTTPGAATTPPAAAGGLPAPAAYVSPNGTQMRLADEPAPPVPVNTTPGAVPGVPPVGAGAILDPGVVSTCVFTNEAGFHFLVMGNIDALTYNPTNHTATARMSAMVYDTGVRSDPREVGTPLAVEAQVKSPRAALTASQAERLALQAAARQMAFRIAELRILSGAYSAPPPRRHAKAGRSFWSALLPIAIGVAAIAFAVSAHSSSSSSQPTYNGDATMVSNVTGGTAHVDLAFTPLTLANIYKYVITRTGASGTVQTDSINVDTQLQSGRYISSDPTIIVGQPYMYSVQAEDFNGNRVGPSRPFLTPDGKTVIDPGQPGPPTGLQLAGAASTAAVPLSWSASANPSLVAYYQVYRSANGGFFSAISGATVTGTTYTDTAGLVAGTVYSYKVEAVSNTTPAVNSADSNILVVHL